MNYYTHHINDYLTATIGLSLEEHGIYILLLQHHYRLEVGVSTADAYKLLAASSRKKRAAVDGILNKFFFFEENLWKNTRCVEEIERYAIAQERSKSLRTAGADRKQKSRETRSMLYALARDLGLDIHWKATADQLLTAIRSVEPGFMLSQLSREADSGQERGNGVTGKGLQEDGSRGVTAGVTQGVTANPLPTPHVPLPINSSVSKDTDANASGESVGSHHEAARFSQGGDAQQQESEADEQSGFRSPSLVTSAQECTQIDNKTPRVTADAVQAEANTLSEDHIAAMWMSGKALIVATDKVSVTTAGTFLGGLVKRYGNEIVHEVVEASMVERPAAMRPWMTAACEDRKQRQLGRGGRRQEALEQSNRVTAQSWAERKAEQLKAMNQSGGH